MHFELNQNFHNLRASINELNREEISRKRSFSSDREQRLSRRESLVKPNSSNAINIENEHLLPPEQDCRRDSLSESNELATRINQLPMVQDPEEQ